ncbi:MAG: hypothetical protein RJA65_782 [Actinomycetota bacterium]
MFVTRHSNVVDPALREKLWRLYRTTYLPTAEATVTHEMLDQDEFNEQISRDSNRVWVVWSDSLPVAMTLVSTDVRATRWLSEIYFEKHFPDRYRAGQVHYIVWVVVDPSADAGKRWGSGIIVSHGQVGWRCRTVASIYSTLFRARLCKVAYYRS